MPYTRPPGYTVIVAGASLAGYDETEIDSLDAYLVPENAWYVIPLKLLKGTGQL